MIWQNLLHNVEQEGFDRTKIRIEELNILLDSQYESSLEHYKYDDLSTSLETDYSLTFTHNLMKKGVAHEDEHHRLQVHLSLYVTNFEVRINQSKSYVKLLESTFEDDQLEELEDLEFFNIETYEIFAKISEK